MSKWIIKHRWWIIVSAWIISLAAGIGIPYTHIDTDVEAMVPARMEARVNTDKIEEMFGGSDMIMLMVRHEDVLDPELMKRVRDLSDGLASIDGIERVMSLFTTNDIHQEYGTLTVSPAVPFNPETAAERENLRNSLLNNDLAMGMVISEDFTLTAIMGTVSRGFDSDLLVEAVDSLIMAHPGLGEILTGGYPVVYHAITADITKDLWLLLPIALLLMVAILWISFRDIKGVLLPFSVVVMSILLSMGIMALFGWKIAMVTILLPVMMIAIANNYGIHVFTRYQETLNGNKPLSRVKQINEILRVLSWPVILTALTTIAGILGLLTHIIVPARQVGVLAALGIAWALALSLLYIPALLSLLSKPRAHKVIKPTIQPALRLLEMLGSTITRHPVRVLVAGGIITLFFALGLPRLKVEGNTINFFKDDDPVKKSAVLIDQHFGGSQIVSVLFSGDCKDPELLKRIDRYEKELKEKQGVGQVMSLATVVRLLSKSLLEPDDPLYDAIPDSREAVAQYLELYSMSGDPSDFEQMVDFNYENTQMIVRLNDGSSQTVLDRVSDITSMTQNDPAFTMTGGVGLISAQMNNQLIKGQRNSLISALLVVCLMVGFIFRNWKSGLYAFTTLGVACVVLFGTMGWLRIPLDAATTLLSSVMIGVGVDYTIHYLWRHRHEEQEGSSAGEAVRKTLTTTGRGIIYNALSVMAGFSVLMISTFKPIQFFGLLVLISILSCMAGAMVLVPSLLIVNKKKPTHV